MHQLTPQFNWKGNGKITKQNFIAIIMNTQYNMAELPSHCWREVMLYPALHSQMYDELVLIQTELSSQPCIPTTHSSTSAKYIVIEHIMLKLYKVCVIFQIVCILHK